MADISQVKLPNGDTYNLVDETSGYITLPDLPVYDGTVVEDGDGYVVDKGFECTESWTTLTEETVTTTEDSTAQANTGTLAYSQYIDVDKLKITFNGTEYELERTDDTSRPFVINYSSEDAPCSVETKDMIGTITNTLIVPNAAGTYTIKIEVPTEVVNTTECFEKAVKSVVKGGKAFTFVGKGTYGNKTYVEYNITYNDFINARNNGTNIVYVVTDTFPLETRNIVAFNYAEYATYYWVEAFYASITEGDPSPTVNWVPLTLYCDTTDGYMRDLSCWEAPN